MACARTYGVPAEPVAVGNDGRLPDTFIAPVTGTPLADSVSVLRTVLAAHLLNDMMQSLLPAIYPMLKESFGLELRADRPDHADLPGHRVAAAAAGRHLYRQAAAAVLAGDRHGFHADRPVAAVARRQLRAAAGRRGADRHGLVGVPSGILARRAHGVGRTARPRAIAVPGRRQCRLGDRAAAGRVHRDAARPDRASPGSRSRRWSRSSCWRIGGWYRAHAPLPRNGAAARRRRRTLPRRTVVVTMAILGALIFSKYFYLASLTSYYTFYPDGKIPCERAERAAASVRVPRRGRRRHDPRRPDRRSHRPQVRDLGLDPRRAAVHAAAAAREPVLDDDADRS